ncbi:MAG: pilus assembly protein TadG-related protein [Hyphomonadaceae bacterium]
MMKWSFGKKPADARRGRGLLSRFRRDRSGAFAIQFALMVIPMVICTGLAIDGGRAFLTRFQLASALDAAALAVGSTEGGGATDAEKEVNLRPLAERFVRKNFRVQNTENLAVNLDINGDVITLTGSVTMNTYFMPLIGMPSIALAAETEVRHGGANVEVALMLDTSGSMDGTRITKLRTAAKALIDDVIPDEESSFYSKIAIVPWASNVHLGALASRARGDFIADVPITGADWRNGAQMTVDAMSRANQAVITINNHGLQNNDYVYLSGVGGNWSSVNDRVYYVTSRTTDTFKLRRASGGAYLDTRNSGWSSTYPGGGRIQKCFNSDCDLRVTAPGHGLSEDEYIWIDDVRGMTDLNVQDTRPWRVSDVTDDTFMITGGYYYSSGMSGTFGTYTSGGEVKCMRYGCDRLLRYASGSTYRVADATNCVTDRHGDEALTDASPETAPVSIYYYGRDCDTRNSVTPLIENKEALNTAIDNLHVDGYTAGHLGAAWGWYMLSPNWSSMWDDTESHPTSYDDEETVKVAVFMTDGEFNTQYCNGVYGSFDWDLTPGEQDCSEPSGNSFARAVDICDGMKDAGITIFSVGVELSPPSGSSSTTNAADVLQSCASSPDYFYLTREDDMTTAFESIAQSITKLRVSK